jgi:long-chain acyl-CoA synthetase
MSGDTATIIVGERIRSRAELLARGRRAATGFAELGVRENDAVALLLRNDFAFLEATHAANVAGAYAVPLNWHASADEITYMLGDSKPKVIVVHADLLEPVRQVIPAGCEILVVPGSDAAAPVAVSDGDREWDRWLATYREWDRPPQPPRSSWIYTSGTTGRPKGVRREPATPQQAAAMRDLFSIVYGCRDGMRSYVGGPLYHASPNAFARQGLAMAEVLVLSSRFDPEELLRQIDRYRLTTLVMVPTFFVRLLKLPEEAWPSASASRSSWRTSRAPMA